jgi:L-aspartate oxidase
MARHVGVVRDAEGLSQALRILGRFNDNARSAAMRNMLVTATMIAAAAWQRRESRGAHFRSDYPEPDPAQARRTFMTWNEAKAIAQTAMAAEPSAAK